MGKFSKMEVLMGKSTRNGGFNTGPSGRFEAESKGKLQNGTTHPTTLRHVTDQFGQIHHPGMIQDACHVYKKQTEMLMMPAKGTFPIPWILPSKMNRFQHILPGYVIPGPRERQPSSLLRKGGKKSDDLTYKSYPAMWINLVSIHCGTPKIMPKVEGINPKNHGKYEFPITLPHFSHHDLEVSEVMGGPQKSSKSFHDCSVETHGALGIPGPTILSASTPRCNSRRARGKSMAERSSNGSRGGFAGRLGLVEWVQKLSQPFLWGKNDK